MVEQEAFGSCFYRYLCSLHVSRVAMVTSNFFITLAISRFMDKDIGIDSQTHTSIGFAGVTQNSDNLTVDVELRYSLLP